MSQDHNLKQERKYVPIRVVDPLTHKALHCEHFHEYGSSSHSLTYFRGNQNIPHAVEPILSALRDLDVIRSLSTESKRKRRSSRFGMEAHVEFVSSNRETYIP